LDYKYFSYSKSQIVHQLDPEKMLVLDTPVHRSFHLHKSKDKYM
jgi:hypothetical protein